MTQWRNWAARFGPGSSIFMFTNLTPQWRADRLFTKQSSEANPMGAELAQQFKYKCRDWSC